MDKYTYMTDLSREKAIAIDEFVEAIIHLECNERDMRLASCTVLHAAPDLRDDKQMEVTYLGTGSYWEGMSRTMCGDIDYMFYNPLWPTVNGKNISDQWLRKGAFLQTEDVPGHPCFVRLCCGDDIVSFPHSAIEDGYISGPKFMAHLMRENTTQHGPAWCQDMFESMPDMATIDNVPCMFSPRWPFPATESLILRKKRCWPSQELLTEIKMLGCHVVAKASPNSERPDVEFRWSFSVAERLLCQSFTADMFACYYLLKAIKRKCWNECANPVMCSYFFKTACFWTFESYQGSSALNNATVVLDWMIECFNKRLLPHFFIHGENLIGHLSKEQCQVLSSQLSEIQQNLIAHVLPSLMLEKPLIDTVDSVAKEVNYTHLLQNKEGHALWEQFFCLADSNEGLVVMQRVLESIRPHGKVYEQRAMLHFLRELSEIKCEISVRMQRMITNHTTSPDFPDRALERLLKSIRSRISGPIFRAIEVCIHSGMGDGYLKSLEMLKSGQQKQDTKLVADLTAGPGNHSLLSNHSDDIIKGMLHKGEHYYRLACVPISTQDFGSENGFVGLVTLACFFWKTNQWVKLNDIIEDLEAKYMSSTLGQWQLFRVGWFINELNIFPRISKMSKNIEVQTRALTVVQASHLLLCKWAVKQGNTAMLERISKTGGIQLCSFTFFAFFDEGEEINVESLGKKLTSHNMLIKSLNQIFPFLYLPETTEELMRGDVSIFETVMSEITSVTASLGLENILAYNGQQFGQSDLKKHLKQLASKITETPVVKHALAELTVPRDTSECDIVHSMVSKLTSPGFLDEMLQAESGVIPQHFQEELKRTATMLGTFCSDLESDLADNLQNYLGIIEKTFDSYDDDDSLD